MITQNDLGLILQVKFPHIPPFKGWSLERQQGEYTLVFWDEAVTGVPKPTLAQILQWGEEIGEEVLRTPQPTVPGILEESLTGTLTATKKKQLRQALQRMQGKPVEV